jgi:hypothetical protein
MKWITRERVKVDQVACPWLRRSQVSPQRTDVRTREEEKHVN